jgi:hypothetical protein
MDSHEYVTIEEAAKKLNLTEAAVRKRISRGQLQTQKLDNKTLVLMTGVTGQKRDKTSRHNGLDKLVARLEADVTLLSEQLAIKDEQIRSYQEEMTRKDLMLAQLLQRHMLPEPNLPDEHSSQDSRRTQLEAGEQDSFWTRCKRFFTG